MHNQLLQALLGQQAPAQTAQQGTTPTSIDQQIAQRELINKAVSGGQPKMPPMTPPAPQGPIDPAGLLAAMKKAGIQGQRTQDIELKPDLSELLARAAALTRGQ